MKDDGSASFQLAPRNPQAGSLRYLPSGREVGYAFALPRLIARLSGRAARRAELSRWEAYGLGILVFGINCVFAAHALLPFVRPVFLRLLVLCVLPFAMWMAFLLLYYVNALVIALLRRVRLYAAPTNNPFQHIVIMSLTTVVAVLLLRDGTRWMCSLGMLWLALLGFNLLAMVILKLRHEF